MRTGNMVKLTDGNSEKALFQGVLSHFRQSTHCINPVVKIDSRYTTVELVLGWVK